MKQTVIDSFYKEKELIKMGFNNIGLNVKISRNAKFYNIKTISIGNNVRIDDFCILSGTINLGSFIHLSAYSALYGHYGIDMKDFSGLSPRCTVLSATDDFSGNCMIGPMVPERMRGVTKGKVRIDKFVQVGAGSIIMPGITLSEGSVIGAMSFVKKSTKSWSIYGGIPARFIKKRKQLIKNKMCKIAF